MCKSKRAEREKAIRQSGMGLVDEWFVTWQNAFLADFFLKKVEQMNPNRIMYSWKKGSNIWNRNTEMGYNAFRKSDYYYGLLESEVSIYKKKTN